jgi:hypothetical protein
MLETKELLEKGDLKIEFVDGHLVVMMNTSAAVFSIKLQTSYLIDKLEEVIPGDQKALAGMLKSALGLAA